MLSTAACKIPFIIARRFLLSGSQKIIDFFFEFSHINKILDAKSLGMRLFEDYATTWYWILM